MGHALRSALPSSTSEALFRELDAADCSRKASRRLKQLVDSGTDLDCYKINAFRIAEELGETRRETLRAFLFATRLGILDMHYDIHCPSCHGVPEFHRHLMGLRNTAHCIMCEIDVDVDFADQVEVTFTPNANVRAVKFAHFHERDFEGRLAWHHAILPREGRFPIVGDCLHPGETRTLSGRLTPGPYLCGVPRYIDGRVLLVAAGAAVRKAQPVHVQVNADGSLTLDRDRVRPGPVDFVVSYGYPEFWGFGVHADRPRRNWVSAAHVTSQQEFRDLFAGEFLAPDVSFAIRNITLMFTDIKASTEMYEQLGDSKAYAVVQEHFRVMSELIRNCEGAIVKTIGDAVMAAFSRNRDAVAAANAIQEAFGRRAIHGLRVEVKLGLHRGPVIAVTSNRSLDYFGRTANIAARVQGRSSAGEILITDAVLEDEEVRALLRAKRLGTKSFAASLKGVSGDLRLHRLIPGQRRARRRPAARR